MKQTLFPWIYYMSWNKLSKPGDFNMLGGVVLLENGSEN